MENTSNSTIAKNTIFLYFRMMFTMIVSLYTSRVILDVLGVDDYGIYQTVGGVVALLSFVNNALSTSSSRFLTYELGAGDFEKLKRTFSSVLTVHLFLAFIVLVIAETGGLWFVYNKLVIPANRMGAAVFAYHTSIFTAFITVAMVPYNSSIISHERMNIYAYLSIVEAVLKLLICYLITIGGLDKLIMYSSLLCFVQILLALLYAVYCIRNFQETHYKFMWNKNIIEDVLGYSGWNLFANMAIALITQGTTILINIFFAPSVVAARSIANQVNMAANQFIGNFRTAANPQIVKKYAAGDYEGSKHLLLESTKYSYYMMLILALPICLVSKELLGIWLKEVPDYTTVFLQIAVITSLFQIFDSSFYTALYAKGRIKDNALVSPAVLFLSFPIIYLLFKLGFSPLSCAIVLLCAFAILGLIIKPFLLVKIVGYEWKDIIIDVFIPCLKITAISCPLPIYCYILADELFPNVWIRFISLVLVSIISVGMAVWYFGLNQAVRKKLLIFIKNEIGNKH